MVADTLSVHLPRSKTETATWIIENEKNAFKAFYGNQAKVINYRALGCTFLNIIYSLLHLQTAFYYHG